MSDLAPQRMHLGMFFWPCGHHLAAWRHPESTPDAGGNMAHMIAVAQFAERGLLRTTYEGTTLRANLVVSRPRWRSGRVDAREAAAE